MSLQLKILLPDRLYGVIENVTRVVVEARGGSFGILPRRLDCVAALKPGILTYATEDQKVVYLAIDEGVLVKSGPSVVISVRHAVGKAALGQLRETVEREFLELDEQQKRARTVVAKLESGFIRRFMEFQHA